MPQELNRDGLFQRSAAPELQPANVEPISPARGLPWDGQGVTNVESRCPKAVQKPRQVKTPVYNCFAPVDAVPGAPRRIESHGSGKTDAASLDSGTLVLNPTRKPGELP